MSDTNWIRRVKSFRPKTVDHNNSRDTLRTNVCPAVVYTTDTAERPTTELRSAPECVHSADAATFCSFVDVIQRDPFNSSSRRLKSLG